jgi:hypothetical protein
MVFHFKRYFKRYLVILAAFFSVCFITFKVQYGLNRINLINSNEVNTLKKYIKEPEYENLQVTNESKLIKKVKKLPECILIGAAKSGKKFKRI